MLKKFTTFEIVIMALMAAIGIAVKPFISYLAHIITGPLFIPAGALAGGFYMAFVIIGAAIVGKPFTATLVCVVQAIIVVVTGMYGSHGVASVLTYIVPGIIMDISFRLVKSYGDTMVSCFVAGMFANICGTFLVNFVFFRLPMIPLILSILLAGFSGGLGGLLSWKVIKSIAKNNLIKESLLCRNQVDKENE